MPQRPMFTTTPFGRRTFLAGAAATTLAACSSSGGEGTDGSDGGGDGTGPSGSDDANTTEVVVAEEYSGDSAELEPATFNLIQRYPSDVPVPGEVRLPFSLSSENAQFVSDGPLVLGAQVTELDGTPVGERVEAVRRDVAPFPYYAFRVQVDEPAFYSIIVDGGPATGANFEVLEPSRVPVPSPGDVLAGFDTPTIGESAGVDPICTREPPCDFHSVTLAEALSVGTPVAYFVGTPAFCQTGSCAPALEALIEVAPDYADRLTIVHAEVWTDLTATVIAPAVEALDMLFEPALFLVGIDGVIIERIDGLWDTTELRERLDLVV